MPVPEYEVLVLQRRVQQLEAALRTINEWDSFPAAFVRTHDRLVPVSYGFAYGSNGERDFMRAVARQALEQK